MTLHAAGCGEESARPLRQLRDGGRMIMPVGGPFMTQNLVFIEKDARGSVTHRNVLPVAFVRLIGH